MMIRLSFYHSHAAFFKDIFEGSLMQEDSKDFTAQGEPATPVMRIPFLRGEIPGAAKIGVFLHHPIAKTTTDKETIERIVEETMLATATSTSLSSNADRM
jgi:hypothetical protein